MDPVSSQASLSYTCFFPTTPTPLICSVS